MDDAITGVIELMEHMSEEERLQVFDLIADFFMLDSSRRGDLMMLSQKLAEEYIKESSSDDFSQIFVKEIKSKHFN